MWNRKENRDFPGFNNGLGDEVQMKSLRLHMSVSGKFQGGGCVRVTLLHSVRTYTCTKVQMGPSLGTHSLVHVRGRGESR